MPPFDIEAKRPFEESPGLGLVLRTAIDHDSQIPREFISGLSTLKTAQSFLSSPP